MSEDGVWYSQHQCYAAPLTPQPGKKSPVWGGNDPAKGSMWGCTTARYQGEVPETSMTWYVPDGQEPALVDPADLARNAADQMPLETPVVHMAPSSPDKTYVSLETWLWMDRGQFRIQEMTVSAGATSVTVVAEPTQVYWAMGDGGGVSCYSEGRPWVKGMSSAAETDCSYTYEQPSGGEKLPVSAQITYQVDWTCSGACLTPSGTLGEITPPAGEAAIQVSERQSVVVQGG